MRTNNLVHCKYTIFCFCANKLSFVIGLRPEQAATYVTRFVCRLEGEGADGCVRGEREVALTVVCKNLPLLEVSI